MVDEQVRRGAQASRNSHLGAREAPIARPRDHPVLAHDTRQLLHRLIQENAGACETDLGRLTELGRNTVKYHLQRLVRANLVNAIKEGRKIHYFPNSMGLVRLQRAIVATQKPMQNKILKLMHERPELSWRAMSRLLDVTPRTVRWHVEQLQRQGLVTVQADGQRHEVVLDAAMAKVLAHQNSPDQPITAFGNLPLGAASFRRDLPERLGRQ